VKLVIAMRPVHYYPFLSACEISSTEYTTLKKASGTSSWNDVLERRTIHIVCDETEAARLFDAAQRLYPEAAQAIKKAIYPGRPR
jgi:hypothetical protein